MKTMLFLLLFAVSTLNLDAQVSRSATALSNQTNSSQTLPIKRVVLYSNGVAYVERRGFVTGSAQIDLSFKQSQVDDVLKSMIVLDMGAGRIGAVSYNSSAPPSARMAEIPFSVMPSTNGSGTNTGIAGVLSQLQGASVLVTAKGVPIKGSILTVEQQEIKTEKETHQINNLVISTENGEIMSFDLADVKGVKLLDTETRNDVSEFAGAAASSRRRDAKTITVTSDGGGRRELMVSYTIAAPIWKTTYRVVLDEEGQPFFQGWAIVDNVSDEDWTDVQLSLVSGSPISFIQELQKPFYRYRPIVPMPADINVTPQMYESGVGGGYGSGSGGGGKDMGNNAANTNVTNRQIVDLPVNARNTSPVQADGSPGAQSNFMAANISVDKTTSVSEALVSDNSGVQTAASGEEIGDLFEYRIDRPMTVMRNRSALIPIVQTKMEGEKVSVYNESVKKDRPLSGMRLLNRTPLTLETGSLTVIDRDAYAGEALMDRLKPKEQRLISYALDLGTHVTVRNDINNEPARLIKAVNGVFQIHYFRAENKTYEISNQTDRNKVLYIEYPIRQGWRLASHIEKPDYTTNKYYRFRVELKPFETKEFSVGETQPLMDSYRIGDLTSRELDLFIERRYIDAETRRKLDKLIAIRDEAVQIEQMLDAFETEEESISEDQGRIRENITALSKTAEAKQLITRYIQKADSQENRIEEIGRERKRLEVRRQELRNRLVEEIRSFSFEQNNQAR